MTHDEDLLKAVISAPDDDAPRLAYAGWLERENQAPRAEFIRLQCALAKMSPDDPNRPERQQRESELLKEFGWEWVAELGTKILEWHFRRGFIERAELDLRTSGDEIVSFLQRTPLRHLRDTTQFDDFSGVLDALPHFQNLLGLEFWGLYNIDNEKLAKILASPSLSKLQTLILHHDRNGELADETVIVEALNSPHRANIEELAVNVDSSWQGPSCKIVSAIAKSPYLRKLRKLNLTNAGDPGNQPLMNMSTIRELGSSPNMAHLEELDLGNASFPIKAWDEVLKWPWLSQLKWLRLWYARQVYPPSTLTVAMIENWPEYREAFEAKVANIDWETEIIGPWERNASWSGITWDEFQSQHLLSMRPFVEQRDFDGLEAKFHADCAKFASEEAAVAIEQLPWDQFQASLEDPLQQSIAAADRPDVTSIHLRIESESNWAGRFHLSNVEAPPPFDPFQPKHRYRKPVAEFPIPQFKEAITAVRRFTTSYRTSNIEHDYFLTRIVATLGRLSLRHPSRVPIYLNCLGALIRV